MKTRLIVVLLGFLGSGMFVACRDDASDKDDDRPGKAVELAFQAKYPGATGVEWESKGVFREADFTLNGREYEAWFNTSGIWLQAEYAVTYTSVPAAIKDFIANSIILLLYGRRMRLQKCSNGKIIPIGMRWNWRTGRMR